MILEFNSFKQKQRGKEEWGEINKRDRDQRQIEKGEKRKEERREEGQRRDSKPVSL